MSSGGEGHYFPPGKSIARRVHEERSVGLLYGQRALLIWAIEPVTYTATVLSSKAGDRPFERLARTAKAQEAVLLGTREEADRVLARVRNQHGQAAGTLTGAAGTDRAGTSYSAFDPELMLWTLAVIADSGRALYETTVGPLSPVEREGLWQDYLRFGELFGMPRSRAPQTYAEFADWFEEKLRSPDLRPTQHALELAPVVAFEQPIPTAGRLNLASLNLIIKGTLPSRVREAFGIPWGSRQEVAFRSLATLHRKGVRPLMSQRVRCGRNDAFFDVVVRGERRRGGTATPRLHNTPSR
jgi:uncharacterized protein (DUF2236 family)